MSQIASRYSPASAVTIHVIRAKTGMRIRPELWSLLPQRLYRDLRRDHSRSSPRYGSGCTQNVSHNGKCARVLLVPGATSSGQRGLELVNDPPCERERRRSRRRGCIPNVRGAGSLRDHEVVDEPAVSPDGLRPHAVAGTALDGDRADRGYVLSTFSNK